MFVDLIICDRIIGNRFLKSSSPFDPLPISLLHNLASFLTPFISTVVNSSLNTGKIPDILKHAEVIPLVKKNNLDNEIISNYRPISQLPFSSKIIEKMWQAIK